MAVAFKIDPIQLLLQTVEEVHAGLNVDIYYEDSLRATNEAAYAIIPDKIGENPVILLNPDLGVYDTVAALADRLAFISNQKSIPVLPDHRPIVKVLNDRYCEKIESLNN